MTAHWKPGDVALVTLTSGQTATAMRSGTDRGEWYAPLRKDSPSFLVGDYSVSEARPLVVIDPEDREQVERLASVHKWMGTNANVVGDLADALREFANPKPPKPEEPTGLGAVVEDSFGKPWVRVNSKTGWWWRNNVGVMLRWADLSAERVLSEGVQA